MSALNKITSHRSSASSRLLLFATLCLAIAISYSNSIYSPFVLDDYRSFITDPRAYIRDFSLHSLLELKNTTFGYNRVIPQITFAIDHLLNRGSMLQYHLTNIIIHALTAIAIFFLTTGILATPAGRERHHFFSSTFFAFFVALLWALNPVQTNAVTYIVQRMASLCALFYITAVACYLHARLTDNRIKRVMFFAATAFFSLAAFLSKENSATLPVTFCLAEFILISPAPLHRWFKGISLRKWLMLAFFILLMLPLLSQPWQHIVNGYDIRHFTLKERLLTELRVVAWYLSLLALPLPGRMCLDHDFTISSSLFSPATTFLSLLFHITILVAAIKKHRELPLLSFGIAWFYLNLAIESTFVPLELVFEHRLYLPSVGFFLILMYGYDFLCQRIDGRQHPDFKKMALLFLVMLASASSLLTTLRNNDWKDSLTIYHDDVIKYPQNPRAAENYALVLGRAGRYDESIAMAQKSISLGKKNHENYIDASSIILNNLALQGKTDDLLKAADRTIAELDPDMNAIGFQVLMLAIGHAYETNGKYDKALTSYQKGIKFISPYTNDFHPDITSLYKAIIDLFNDIDNNAAKKELLQWSGDENDVSYRLIDLSLATRRYGMAKLLIDKTLDAHPNDAKATEYRRRLDSQLRKNDLAARDSDIRNHQLDRNNFLYRCYMGTISFIAKRYRPLAGLPLYILIKKVQNLVPDDPFIETALIKWSLANDKSDQALAVSEQLAKKTPDFVPGLEAIAATYLRLEQPNKAAIVYQHLLDLYPGHPDWQNIEYFLNKNRALQ